MAEASDNIYVCDLPPAFDEESVRATFEQYGTVTQCRVLPDKTGGVGKTAALVRFVSVAEAEWVVENINGNIPQGLSGPVKARFADTPASKAARQEGSWGGASAGGAGHWVGKVPCKFFAQGNCTKGDLCTFSHGKAGGAAAGGGNGSWGAFFGKGGKSGAKSGPYSSGFAAKGAIADKGSWGGKGKGGKGKGGMSIGMLIKGLIASEALPGGTKYENDENTLYVAGLPADTSDLDLYKIFASFGAVAPRGVRAMLKEDGTCKGIGFVNYLDSLASSTAIATLNGTQLPDGGTLVVKVKSPPTHGKGGKGGADGAEAAEAAEAE